MQTGTNNPLAQEPYQLGCNPTGSSTITQKADKVRLSQTKIELNYMKSHRKIVAQLLQDQNIDSHTKRLIMQIYDKAITVDNIISYWPYPIFEFTQHLCNGTLPQLLQRCSSAVQVNKKSLANRNK